MIAKEGRQRFGVAITFAVTILAWMVAMHRTVAHLAYCYPWACKYYAVPVLPIFDNRMFEFLLWALPVHSAAIAFLLVAAFPRSSGEQHTAMIVSIYFCSCLGLCEFIFLSLAVSPADPRWCWPDPAFIGSIVFGVVLTMLLIILTCLALLTSLRRNLLAVLIFGPLGIAAVTPIVRYVIFSRGFGGFLFPSIWIVPLLLSLAIILYGLSQKLSFWKKPSVTKLLLYALLTIALVVNIYAGIIVRLWPLDELMPWTSHPVRVPQWPHLLFLPAYALLGAMVIKASRSTPSEHT